MWRTILLSLSFFYAIACMCFTILMYMCDIKGKGLTYIAFLTIKLVSELLYRLQIWVGVSFCIILLSL